MKSLLLLLLVAGLGFIIYNQQQKVSELNAEVAASREATEEMREKLKTATDALAAGNDSGSPAGPRGNGAIRPGGSAAPRRDSTWMWNKKTPLDAK